MKDISIGLCRRQDQSLASRSSGVCLPCPEFLTKQASLWYLLRTVAKSRNPSPLLPSAPQEDYRQHKFLQYQTNRSHFAFLIAIVSKDRRSRYTAEPGAWTGSTRHSHKWCHILLESDLRYNLLQHLALLPSQEPSGDAQRWVSWKYSYIPATAQLFRYLVPQRQPCIRMTCWRLPWTGYFPVLLRSSHSVSSISSVPGLCQEQPFAQPSPTDLNSRVQFSCFNHNLLPCKKTPSLKPLSPAFILPGP